VLDHLRGRTDGDHVAVVEPGDARFGLEVCVVDELRLVALLDDGTRSGERGVDVTLVELPTRKQVALLVDERRAVLERGCRIRDDGQLLVVDLDQLGRCERGVLRLGGVRAFSAPTSKV
jgi:hypothetical protein